MKKQTQKKIYTMTVVFETEQEYKKAISKMLPGEKRSDFLKRMIKK